MRKYNTRMVFKLQLHYAPEGKESPGSAACAKPGLYAQSRALTGPSTVRGPQGANSTPRTDYVWKRGRVQFCTEVSAENALVIPARILTGERWLT